MKPSTTTSAFVERLRAIDYRTLPAPAVDMARQVFLDGLGVIVAGAAEPLGVGRISIDYVRAMGGAEQATVVTGGFKTSMQNAAYANGTMAHALDWDNTWYPLNHPTSPTLPAILAIAEHRRLPGERIIEAIAAAFEVQARLRLAATGLKTGQGFHKPGTTGTFGAVAGSARLLGLDHEQTLMALGLAGSRAGSIALNTGTMTKSSHSGHAARMGVECAVLAQMGWTATADVFGPKGFFDTFLNGDGRPELLTEGFAAPLRMVEPGVGFKKYPSNYFTHRPIDAALALREEHRIRPEQIARVEVVFPPFDYVNRPHPRSGLDGKFSIQYTTLVALLDGDITVDSFTNERRFAPDVEALLPAVTLTVDPSIPTDFDQTWATVNVWLKDGRALGLRMATLSGWIGHPLTREQRLKKFFSCTRHAIDERDARRVLEQAERLETLPDITEIMTIARGPATPRP
ncbi:MmgE/PrpD family protein [Pigmentiphaga soli]|uniref:MmgE/PrpD family protein n=1 Tax=Pigmentiphaga soli TaxID=1007095 RepID=A0ABP8GZI8_9BURK